MPSLIPPRDVDPRQHLPTLEREILERWRERDVFARSIAQRDGAEPWVFYEGPPTANGRPGTHHVLARVFKDIYPRYRTMRGRRVERKGGWDCHGLPVEIAVEQELGIRSKAEIEDYGIAEFNARCRESVFRYLEDWNALTERIGFWVDLDHAYRTLDPGYVESVWWALAQIHERGLLYEGHRVVPYCPRCGTALSSHEVALGYRDVTDPSVYVRLPVRDVADSPLQPGDELLIWTTTPWTLPSNAAVAVDADLDYVRARSVVPGGDPDDALTVVIAAELRDRVLGPDAEVLDRFPGRTLEGVSYEPPFPYLAASEWGPRGHTVLLADFVTAAEGTGLVHTAVAFGEDDFRLGEQAGLNVVNPVRPDGTFDERIGPYAGRFVKDADADLIEDLRARGRLWRATEHEHSYPHCWRCGTPLLYYAKPSWYLATSQVRDRMLAANETVDWHPGHIKHGRFGDWLANNVDWAISRERYWGTPLPFWRCPSDHLHVVASLAELHERSGVRLEDPHRPFVDDVTFPCPQCEQPMRRVPEVLDVWFDSGSMPFAQHHAPLHGDFEDDFPADFICEALDQTRGWFYSLLAVSTLLFDRAPYRNVVCLGLIVDDEGQKMSKSRGNVIEPAQVLDAHGADALRWYFFTAKAPWDGYRFSTEAVGECVRLFLRQLWNAYYFYVLYARVNVATLGAADDGPGGASNDLDAWLRARTEATARIVSQRLDAFDTTASGRAIAELVDDLSNWYVRRSRRRFWDGEPAAFATLRDCLLTIARLLAPFCPFMADEIYDNLDGALGSVHLCDFPEPGPASAEDEELLDAMATARETVRLGLAARAQAKLKIRQPLAEAVVVAAGRERAQIERLADVVRDELNVRAVRFVAAADELGSYAIKPNYRTLGPRFGASMPRAAAAVAALDPATAAATVRAGGSVAISVDGDDHELTADDLLLSLEPLAGYSVEREGGHAVALELQLDDSLLREGQAREIVHAVQAARRNAGLAVEDRIVLTLDGDAALLAAARRHEAYLCDETLTVELTRGEGGDHAHSETVSIDGMALTIALSAA